jgi:hypothetical protein
MNLSPNGFQTLKQLISLFWHLLPHLIFQSDIS